MLPDRAFLSEPVSTSLEAEVTFQLFLMPVPSFARDWYTEIRLKIIHVSCARVTRTRSECTGIVDGGTVTSMLPLTNWPSCTTWLPGQSRPADVLRGPVHASSTPDRSMSKRCKLSPVETDTRLSRTGALKVTSTVLPLSGVFAQKYVSPSYACCGR